MCQRVSELRSAMKDYAVSFDASLLSVGDAGAVVEAAGAIEAMAAVVKAAAAARVASTDQWRCEGARSAAHHLAQCCVFGLHQRR